MKHIMTLNELKTRSNTDDYDYGKKLARDENAPSIEQSKEFEDLVQKHNLINITTPLQRNRNTVRFILPTTGKLTYTDARSYVLYPNGVIRGETLADRFALANKNFTVKHQTVIDRLGVIRTSEDVAKMIDRVDAALKRSKDLDAKIDYVRRGGDPERWAAVKKLLRSSPKLKDMNDKTGLFN